MKMKLKDGKSKVLTLSYDDGVVQDKRLLGIINKYGLKCTFNISSGLYFPENSLREKYYGRMTLSEAKELYINSGHELAAHGYTHSYMDQLDSTEILYEVTEDRKRIEKDYGTFARGFAFPYGSYNEKVLKVLEDCGIAYARTGRSTHSFKFPENWLTLDPTCRHRDEKLMELIKRFVEIPHKKGNCEMFYLIGHSYEFDDNCNWEIIEKFAEYAGNHDHIWYATTIEVYDYVHAYENLITSYDKRIVKNPSSIDIWFEHAGKIHCVKAGETITTDVI